MGGISGKESHTSRDIGMQVRSLGWEDPWKTCGPLSIILADPEQGTMIMVPWGCKVGGHDLFFTGEEKGKRAKIQYK